MMFIAILIALVIERFFDWSHLRQWNWFIAFQRVVANKLQSQSPYLILAISIVPFVFIVAAINIILQGLLFGFPKLIFQLIILMASLGAQNLWADTFACINILRQGDARNAAEKLKAAFDINDMSDPQKLHQQLVQRIFIASNHRIFAAVFWFFILGPAGAILYRLTTLSFESTTKESVSPDATLAAENVESTLDWVPVRILTFLFALGGQFVQVLNAWRKKMMLGIHANEELLTDCGFAALGFEDHAKISEDGSVEEAAISLLDRTFVIALVFIALIVLVI
ncbi:MAG: hypothetical protein ACD_46C00139G0002 [uncultured bacterium]|nr:MAG: hypothetical protein ACD_46C00139G0002 [uncultured bacterium]